MVKIAGKSITFLIGMAIAILWMPVTLFALYVSGSISNLVHVLGKMGIEGYGLLIMIPVIFAVWAIPLFVMSFILNHSIAKTFGYGVGMALGLTFVPVIFWPYLGFGSSVYSSPILLTTDSQAANVPVHKPQESIAQQLTVVA